MTLWQYMDEGGPIMYVLLAMNVWGIALMGYKLYRLTTDNKNAAQIGDQISTKVKTLNPSSDKGSQAELAKQEIQAFMNQSEKGLNSIRVIASIAPLLGLLGTVLGVYMAFKVIAVKGLSDPNNFASGLSLALITTIGGLIVAIPHYIGHSYIISLLDRLEINLERETTRRLI